MKIDQICRYITTMAVVSLLFVVSRENVLAGNTLEGRAVLDAATFASGPTSGTLIGEGPINGQEVPFIDKTSSGFFCCT